MNYPYYSYGNTENQQFQVLRGAPQENSGSVYQKFSFPNTCAGCSADQHEFQDCPVVQSMNSLPNGKHHQACINCRGERHNVFGCPLFLRRAVIIWDTTQDPAFHEGWIEFCTDLSPVGCYNVEYDRWHKLLVQQTCSETAQKLEAVDGYEASWQSFLRNELGDGYYPTRR